jgi:hypothetical protein
MKLWKMKKRSDFDHEIMNFVEKNVGTPAILDKTLLTKQDHFAFVPKVVLLLRFHCIITYTVKHPWLSAKI